MRIVVMPMAGSGSRFSNLHPDKKLMPIPPNNDPMFIHAIKNIGFEFDKIVLLPQKANQINSVLNDFKEIKKKSVVIETNKLTRGPLDTVMYARQFLEENPHAQLLICNCDQVLSWPGDWALEWFRDRNAVGGIPTVERYSERHSYAKIDENYACKIIAVKEKQKISNRATIGLYWFQTTFGFLKAADTVFDKRDTAPNGEYYVSHVYNYLKGLILEYPLCEFWSLGEPENYLNYISKNYMIGMEG